MNLYERYLNLKKETPMPMRDMAISLGVSEGELLSVLPNTRYLGSDAMVFLAELEALGEVKSIVRNPVAVHEKKGIYKNLDLSPMMGTAINLGGLDLRIFVGRWKHIFAYQDEKYTSFQFFDVYGQAIQKVYVTEKESLETWNRLSEQYLNSTLPQFEQQTDDFYEVVKLSDEQVQAYQSEWKGLKNVHHFRVVLAQFGIDRLQGLEIAPDGDAVRLNQEAIEYIFNECVSRNITLLTFVNNSGMVQIQTGKVHNVVRKFDWLNILDDEEEKFSLHLDDKNLSEIWFVRRPGSNGIVHSLEAYDSKRELVLQLFGRQADAEVEPEEWRVLINDVLAKFKQ